MRTLRQCLLDTDAALLRVIASRWSIDATGLKPRDLVARVESELSQPARASKMMEVLSPAERDAFRSLLAAAGTLPAINFAQRFGSIRPVGPARLEREQPWRSPVSPAEGLWYLGFIYRGFEQLPNGAMREVYFAPQEFVPLLPLLKVSAPPLEPLPLSAPPAQVESIDDQLADDLCTLLDHLHNNFVRISGSLKISIDYAQLDRLLHRSDAAWIDFIIRLAIRARLLKIDNHRLRPDPKPAADWLQATARDQLRILFEAWRTDPQSTLTALPLVLEPKGAWIKDPIAAGAAILAALRGAVPNTWHAVQALPDRMQSNSPDFARSEFDTGYIKNTVTAEYLRGFEAWNQVEGELIRYILSQPLHWLGMIDLGSSDPTSNIQLPISNLQSLTSNFVSHPLSFRLSHIGASLLGLESDEAAKSMHRESHFIIHPNATIDVVAARRYDRFQLARIANLIDRRKGEYIYRITPSSLARAQSQKITSAKAIEFLAHAAGRVMPPSVIKAIERWTKKGAEVKVERAVLVRVKDAAILKRLQESPKTKSIAIEVLGPTAARINERDWPKLAAILAESGVLVDE
ncbi:MAG TPA: helicase-associated domain-containing protein [Anaerolineae bacterium]|nr:helicase-associated domain-containing protein [Anaerolineae bacterium]